jgi:hypothetical protein
MPKKDNSTYYGTSHHATFEHWVGPMDAMPTGVSKTPGMLPKAAKDGKAEGKSQKRVGDGRSD